MLTNNYPVAFDPHAQALAPDGTLPPTQQNNLHRQQQQQQQQVPFPEILRSETVPNMANFNMNQNQHPQELQHQQFQQAQAQALNARYQQQQQQQQQQAQQQVQQLQQKQLQAQAQAQSLHNHSNSHNETSQNMNDIALEAKQAQLQQQQHTNKKSTAEHRPSLQSQKSFNHSAFFNMPSHNPFDFNSYPITNPPIFDSTLMLPYSIDGVPRRRRISISNGQIGQIMNHEAFFDTDEFSSLDDDFTQRFNDYELNRSVTPGQEQQEQEMAPPHVVTGAPVPPPHQQQQPPSGFIGDQGQQAFASITPASDNDSSVSTIPTTSVQNMSTAATSAPLSATPGVNLQQQPQHHLPVAQHPQPQHPIHHHGQVQPPPPHPSHPPQSVPQQAHPPHPAQSAPPIAPQAQAPPPQQQPTPSRPHSPPVAGLPPPNHLLIYNNEIIYNPNNGPIMGTAAWKKERLLERNRIAASKCRQRKKQAQMALQENVTKMEQDLKVKLDQLNHLQLVLSHYKMNIAKFLESDDKDEKLLKDLIEFI